MPQPCPTTAPELPHRVEGGGALVTGIFEESEFVWRRPGGDPVPGGTVTGTRPVGVAIDVRDNFDGTSREVLRFVDAVSGKEAFTLDADLRAELSSLASAGSPFRICKGVPGERPSCDVDPREVLGAIAFLRASAATSPRP